MSKLMLARASTVVIRNRRRYSVRSRNARPRRQSAPTVLQRAPASPSARASYPHAALATQKGTEGKHAGPGATFTYVQPSAPNAPKDPYWRRGSIQPQRVAESSKESIRDTACKCNSFPISAVVASANAALAKVQLDSPKSKRITFQDLRRDDSKLECQEGTAYACQRLERTLSTSGQFGSRSDGRGVEVHMGLDSSGHRCEFFMVSHFRCVFSLKDEPK